MLTRCAEADQLSMRLYLLMGRTADQRRWRRVFRVWVRAHARADRRRREFEAQLAWSPGRVIHMDW